MHTDMMSPAKYLQNILMTSKLLLTKYDGNYRYIVLTHSFIFIIYKLSDKNRSYA